MSIDESYDAAETVRHCEATYECTARGECYAGSVGVPGCPGLPRDDDSAATYWYGKWVAVSVERDEAIADRDRWRDSWERGDWSREQWERERAQESTTDV